jgi:hypothetical protein
LLSVGGKCQKYRHAGRSQKGEERSILEVSHWRPPGWKGNGQRARSDLGQVWESWEDTSFR